MYSEALDNLDLVDAFSISSASTRLRSSSISFFVGATSATAASTIILMASASSLLCSDAVLSTVALSLRLSNNFVPITPSATPNGVCSESAHSRKLTAESWVVG